MNLRLELFVEDVKKSLDFYEKILGFDVPKEIEPNKYIAVSKGDVTLGLGEMKRLPEHHPLKVSNSSKQPGLGIEIVLEVKDINDAYKKVIDQGYPIETKLGKRSWGLDDFRIIDPDGYYFRITTVDSNEL